MEIIGGEMRRLTRCSIASRNELNMKMTKNRRDVLKSGLIWGIAGTVLATQATQALANPSSRQADAKVLNNAMFYEHQAIWAYSFAATKLSQTNVGKAVLQIALANQADHKAHRDTLIQVIRSLGATPVVAKSEYLDTVKPYIERQEGNLDSDVNIAYANEATQLNTPTLITAGASIGSNEAATVIRAAFKSLGVDLQVVSAPFVNKETRNARIAKV